MVDCDPNKIAYLAGCYIAELRKDKGITQKALGDIIHMSLSNVSHYEQGIYAPPAHTLVAIGEYFKVNCDYILGRTKFRSSYSVLNDRYVDCLTLGEVLNKLLEIPPKHRRFIIQMLDYIEESAKISG